MFWTQPVLLSCLVVAFTVTLFEGADSAVLSDKKDVKASDPQGALRKIFMPEADASNFFKRRSRRATKSQDEIDGEALCMRESSCRRRQIEAEQRQRLAADQRMRQYHEEQRNKFENYAEEENDEQEERTRQSTEQWREFHYDGLDPPYDYNRHTV
ncbi:putative cartilage matrix-associated protein [Triplophysa tibetana]|uniref:Unique cartilage matrix-associated protein n=1 Tax=Triplophysa tibetana TaxID=1572043 RepID=A0A5A9PS86_9TELE|nr:putative cartilage matrix-associated protein [Triplophysa tibetana]